MSDELKKLSESLLVKAKSLGATAADTIILKNHSRSVELQNGKPEKISQYDRFEIGLRVFIGNRAASTSTTSRDTLGLDKLTSQAIEMAKEAPPDEFSGLASSSQYLEKCDPDKLKICDNDYPNIGINELKSFATRVENAALKQKGTSNCESGSSATLAKFHLASSNGFSNGYSRTSYQIFCAAIAGEDSLMERDFASESRAFVSDLPDSEYVGKLAADRAIARLNPELPKTGSFPVLFDERVSSSLISHLMSAINGQSISRGSSWLLNSLGKRILPKDVSLSEDPTRQKIFGSRPFDSEGIETLKKDFIRHGKLENLVLDLKSAKQLDLTSTGNAYRTSASPPYPGVGNLKLSGGQKTRSELLKQMRTGFLVTSLIGSTINQNTGDYSRGASGFWVDGGEIKFPVNNCTIAANLKDMLINITPANDSRAVLSHEIPSILVENMIIAGR